jgi:hypothetical protein
VRLGQHESKALATSSAVQKLVAGRQPEPIAIGETDADAKFSGEIALSKREVTLACGARNVSRRLSGASACGRAVVGVQVSRDRLWFSCGHENRADVCVSAWRAGKSVS